MLGADTRKKEVSCSDMLVNQCMLKYMQQAEVKAEDTAMMVGIFDWTICNTTQMQARVHRLL